MMKHSKIAPTLACCNLMNVEDDIKIMDSCNVDTYHVDIMDGSFVPNYCLSWDFVRALKSITSTPIDIHLMTLNTDRDIDTAISLSVSGIAFHVEVEGDVRERLSRIRDNGIKAGLAVSPETPISSIEQYLSELDYVLLMGVKPGFSGQKFLDATYSRIENLSSIREKNDLSFEIYVDGGISNEIGHECARLGSDILVAGKPSIFRTLGKLKEQTEEFRVSTII